jgi:hypothetical protein
MKVEWTVLTAYICKLRCEARTISGVHSPSAPVGDQAT